MQNISFQLILSAAVSFDHLCSYLVYRKQSLCKENRAILRLVVDVRPGF